MVGVLIHSGNNVIFAFVFALRLHEGRELEGFILSFYLTLRVVPRCIDNDKFHIIPKELDYILHSL